jgi:tetratricopeptide (TPR) repeat protein
LLAIPVILLSAASFQRSAVWANSIVLWRDAVSKVPHEDNWKKLGDAYYFSDKNMKEMAMQAYLRALEKNPYLIEALYSVGALSNEAGDYATAYDALTRLLAVNANHVMGRAALGYTQQKLGEVAAAEKSYRMALALQPESVQILTLLGDLALGQGEFDKAREFYGKLESKGGGAPDSAFLLACTELRSGRRDEAYAWLEKSLRRGFRNYSGVCNIREFSRAGVDPRFAALLEKYSRR